MNVVGEAQAPNPMYYTAREACRLTNNARNSSQSKYSKDRARIKNYFLTQIEKRVREGYSTWFAENAEEDNDSFVDNLQTEIYIDILNELSNSGYRCGYKFRKDSYRVIDLITISWYEADEHPGSLYCIN